MPADIVIYAVVAAGLVLWLRNILGTRSGDERQRPNPFTAPDPTAARKAPNDAIATPLVAPELRDLRDGLARNMTITDSEVVESALRDVMRMDKSFTPSFFLTGAQDAFVMIVEAFAEGDRDTLKDLLGPGVYTAFSSALDSRERAGEKASVEVHAVRHVDLRDARIDGRTAYITVRFVADETNVVRDRDGAVLSGNPERMTETIDVWVFGRDLKSKSPAWLVYETRDEDAAALDHKTVPDFKV